MIDAIQQSTTYPDRIEIKLASGKQIQLVPHEDRIFLSVSFTDTNTRIVPERGAANNCSIYYRPFDWEE